MKLDYLWSRNRLRSLLILLGVSALLSTQPEVQAQVAAPQVATPQETYTKSLTFATAGQSIWEGEDSLIFDKFLGYSWNPQVLASNNYYDASYEICDPTGLDLGCIGFSAGRFGAGASIDTGGTAGVRYVAKAIGGKVDVSYPIDLTINYPASGTLYPGDTYTISTAYAPGRAGPGPGAGPGRA